MKISKLKVLELASVLAGPHVGSFFAENGAEVIKVENKKFGGDVTRNWRLASEDKNRAVSAYYASANTGKTCEFLDFTSPNDIKRTYELVTLADIVIANFKPGDAEKFGLAFNQLKQINPSLIYGEITGFGSTSNRSAFDVILQAETGYISMTGNNPNNLAKLPVAFIDLFAAHQLKEGLLIALLENTKPCKVSVSLYDSAIASLANQASNYLMEQHIPMPLGTAHPNIAPYGDLFTTQDNKQITFAIGSDKHFAILCSLLKIKPFEKFETNLERVKNRQELLALIQQKVSEINRKFLLARCEELKIPAGGVYNLKEVFELEAAQQLVLSEMQEGVATKKVKTSVFTFSF